MNWLRRHIWLLLALAIAVLAGRMLLTTHHFYVHDDIQVFRVNEYITCFKTGQIPCRWSSELGKGYGEPWFNYYPPMIYLIPSLIHLSGFSLITSLNLFMFMTFILAGWGMYGLVKELCKRDDLACVGSVLFTLYPFHATNVFLRGVYAENLAWSLTPLILLYIYRQIVRGGTSRILPLLFAILFLTHIISSFLVVGLALGWALLISTGPLSLKGKNIGKLGLQIAAGLCLAAFFFVPAIAEKGLVQSESLIAGYYGYFNHFVSLKQLFVEYKWNYGASYWGEPPEEMGFMVGHVHTLLLIAAAVLSLLFARAKLRKNAGKLVLGILFATLMMLLLTHAKSAFIWKLLPDLAYVQFPWRFVAWAGIPLVLSISILLSVIPTKLARTISYITIAVLCLYSYPFFFPRGYDQYQDSDFLSGSLRHDQQTKSLFDYLPKTVHQVPERFADTLPSPQVFYFPGWTANQPIQPNAVSGIIEPVDSGAAPLKLAWTETPFRKAMDLVSLVSLVIYGFYLRKSHVQ